MFVNLLKHPTRFPAGLVVLLPIAVWVVCTVACSLKTGEIHANGMYAFRRNENPFAYWLIVVVHVTVVSGFFYVLVVLA